MKQITLSYILTTYNKFTYLSVTLPILIQNKKEDEEIIVVDGGSTDGTCDYLQKLFEEKKIDRFITEKDYGEAHGTNKAILLSTGNLIKIITDDDVFHYPTINTCKNFMLSNTHIDMLGFDGFGFNTNHQSTEFETARYIEGFKKWQKTKQPFLMCGLSYLFRKSSLAYMGLLNTNFIIVDIEYSIRISSMKTKIAFYTGMGYVNLVNPQSNSHRFYETINREKKMLTKMYKGYNEPYTLKRTVLKIKDKLATIKPIKKTKTISLFDYTKIVDLSLKKLEEYNANKKFEFLT